MTVAPQATAQRDTRPPSARSVVESTAGRFIAELQGNFLADRSAAVGTLAQLRRGAGKLPSQTPELWGITGTERLLQHDLFATNEARAERAETGYFVAVTLYALHQQSQRTAMHKQRVDLGEAVRRLMPHGEMDETIRRRFVRLGTAATADVLAYRLREIVSLLRGAGIPLDYGRLAGQLYQAQTADGLLQVRRDWSRSFHSYRAEKADDPTDHAAPGNTPEKKDVS